VATYQTLLTESRELLQDTESPYRYSDDILINQLNRGLQEMARIRPDAFWDLFDMYEEDVTVPVVTAGTLGTTWPLHLQFYAPLVSWVVAWAEVLDDEFTTDGRANMLLQQFKTQLLGI
jgi:hypothetical protein